MKPNEILFMIIIFLGLFLYGCSQGDDSPKTEGYYVKFKIDGETIQFTETTAYTFDRPSVDPRYYYSINGGDGDSGFTINLGDNSPIEVNRTYQNTLIGGVPEGYLLYNLPDADSYTYSSWVTAPFQPELLSCTIKILEVTDNNIKGTFTGEMRKLENNEKVSVTQGEFNVKRMILGVNP